MAAALQLPGLSLYISGQITDPPMIPRLIAAAAVVAAAALHPAVAQDRRVPASTTELRLSYAPVVQKVTPSVVNVYAARVVENRNPFMEDPFFRRFFGAWRIDTRVTAERTADMESTGPPAMFAPGS